MRIVLLLVFFCFKGFSTDFNLSAYHPKADGITDDTHAFLNCFKDVQKAGGGTVTIPAGSYFVKGDLSIPLGSNTTVFAYGAKFYLPKDLGNMARITLFQGTDIVNLSWFGGYFKGYCFDHRNPPNTWEPNVCTRIIVINTSPTGITDNIIFRDMGSEKVAGSIIFIEGAGKNGSESETLKFATNIAVENCTFVNSGKFMWDYGLLWQILIWSEEYTPIDVEMAKKYFRNELIRESIKMEDKSDKISFENSHQPIPISANDHAKQVVCFYGDKLPSNIVKGKKYYITASGPDYIKISETFGGKPVIFTGSAGIKVKMIHNLFAAFYELYAPTGQGPGKGSVDLVGCKNVSVKGCKLSALGDGMHIQRCQNTIFANNHIMGARMGAFFLAEYCKNSTIIGNQVDGTNGSRVMSVEKSNEDVNIIGNTFRNGGRGSWINQPRNLVMQGNIFINNTTKCEHDPWRGRKTFHTGDWERYSEMYFTTHEPDGKYGSIIIKDNIFTTGPEAKSAIEFQPNGSNITIDGNIFNGSTGMIVIGENTQVEVGKNPGAIVIKGATDVRMGNK